MVELKNLYLLIDFSIMTECLNNEENIYYCYYPDTNKLLIAPVSAVYFTKIHKCVSTFLKLRNANGTRSFQLTNIFLDNPVLMENDRELEFSTNKNVNILTVFL